MITRNWLWNHATVNRKITAGIGCDRKAHVTELSLAQWSLSIEYLSSWCISWQSKFSTSQWTRYISIRVILWALIVRARNVAQWQRFQFSIKNLMCLLSYIILILEGFWSRESAFLHSKSASIWYDSSPPSCNWLWRYGQHGYNFWQPKQIICNWFHPFCFQ